MHSFVSSHKTRLVRHHRKSGVVALAFSIPGCAFANFAWPPAYYYLSFSLWWVVISGLTVEFVAPQLILQALKANEKISRFGVRELERRRKYALISREAHRRVEVSLGQGHERGQTIVDHLGNTKRTPNCRVVYRVDRERFIRMVKAACIA